MNNSLTGEINMKALVIFTMKVAIGMRIGFLFAKPITKAIDLAEEKFYKALGESIENPKFEVHISKTAKKEEE